MLVTVFVFFLKMLNSFLFLMFQDMDSGELDAKVAQEGNGSAVGNGAGNGAHEGNGNGAQSGNGAAADALPPPPPVMPTDFVPTKVDTEAPKKKVARVPMSRRGLGSKGQKITLLTNHFKVNVTKADGNFFHYSVG